MRSQSAKGLGSGSGIGGSRIALGKSAGRRGHISHRLTGLLFFAALAVLLAPEGLSHPPDRETAEERGRIAATCRDAYALARNIGTSVQMLETFYGHTTNRTMATELTKNKGKQKKSFL